ncbi:hypothetical protein OIU76_017043 [Salix suchowensis]|nr:hypothetical protein OIU76_017043 [Salix suchowensis]KAJ6340813.1 hypothetical protein OIU78_009062 [Salix suchowensis]
MNPLMQKDCQRKSWAALLSLVGREIRRSKLRKLGIQRTMTMETKHEEMAHDEKYAGYAPETADETGTEKELYSFYDRFYESKQNN